MWLKKNASPINFAKPKEQLSGILRIANKKKILRIERGSQSYFSGRIASIKYLMLALSVGHGGKDKRFLERETKKDIFGGKKKIAGEKNIAGEKKKMAGEKENNLYIN